MNKKFLKLRYAAIKRFGEKKWTAADGRIEFNPNYTVSCSDCEKGHYGNDKDRPYIIELSNGTKFLTFMHTAGAHDIDLLSESGEVANEHTSDDLYDNLNAYYLNYFQN